MTDFQFFMPIEKVQKAADGTCVVSGYASTPTKDMDGEIVSLEAVKKALPGYMQWRNIREMHQLKAVGRAQEGHVDSKGLWISAKISDPTAVQKCLDRVYQGFSIGGKKLAKAGDTITEIEMTEISICDRPANPDARFDVAKSAKGKWTAAPGVALIPARTPKDPEAKALRAMAKAVSALSKGANPPAAPDGFSLPAKAKPNSTPGTATVELNPVPSQEPDGSDSINDSRPEENVTRKAGESADPEGAITPCIKHGVANCAKCAMKSLKKEVTGAAKEPYGDVEYADPGHQADGKKRYPVDTAAHIRAAWNYIAKPKNAGKYKPDQAAAVKAKILAAWKSKVDPSGPPSAVTKSAWNFLDSLSHLQELETGLPFLDLGYVPPPEIMAKRAKPNALSVPELPPRTKSNAQSLERNPVMDPNEINDPLVKAMLGMLAKAQMPSKAARVAKAMEDMKEVKKATKEAMEAIKAAHEMHKSAFIAKAAGGKTSKSKDDADGEFDHTGAMEKLNKAYGALDKAMTFRKAAAVQLAKTVTRAGQQGQEAGDPEEGFYTPMPTVVKDMTPGAMSGAKPGDTGSTGIAPAYPDDGSVYPGKAGSVGDLRKYADKNGMVPAAVAELLTANAALSGANTALARMPDGRQRPYSFDMTKVGDGVYGTKGSPAERQSLQKVLFDGVDPAALMSSDEQVHGAASARAAGNYLIAPQFAKSVLDGNFHGAAGSRG